jgi:hypothetical protein
MHQLKRPFHTQVFLCTIRYCMNKASQCNARRVAE